MFVELPGKLRVEVDVCRAFTSLCYSADGAYLLAGGQSKNVCIYNVAESLIVKKFEITQNRSLDAVDVS
jgi:periodic tryptophan protein 2